MRKNVLLGVAIAILGSLIAVGPRLVFRVCDSPEMRCFLTARAELGIGLALVALGVLLAVIAGEGARFGVSVSIIPIGIVSALIPKALIGVCAKPMMNCHAVSGPALTALAVVVTGLAAASVWTTRRGARS